jgi:hypothetical protein
LFDIFIAEIAEKPMPLLPLVSVEYAIEKNIDRILADARYIFTQHAGHPCAICVKVIDDAQPGDTPFDLKVSTQWRDPISARSNRTTGDNVKYTLVEGNTPDEVLFTSLGGRFYDDVWANDNLKELENCGLYKNSRDYYKDFNAAIVAGIPNLEANKKLQWRGFFCIDNHSGGLNNEAAKNYAREFAARLSIMIYRFKVLKDSREQPWIKSTMTTRVSRT